MIENSFLLISECLEFHAKVQKCHFGNFSNLAKSYFWPHAWNPLAFTHWDFLCSDCSNLNLIRWWILLIVSFVRVNSDKMIGWWTKTIKWTLEIILIKMKISASWRRCSEIFKTNLKTCISPLLNCPQECKGCQKNQKAFRFFT